MILDFVSNVHSFCYSSSSDSLKLLCMLICLCDLLIIVLVFVVIHVVLYLICQYVVENTIVHFPIYVSFCFFICSGYVFYFDITVALSVR